MRDNERSSEVSSAAAASHLEDSAEVFSAGRRPPPPAPPVDPGHAGVITTPIQLQSDSVFSWRNWSGEPGEDRHNFVGEIAVIQNLEE